jgi:hypothetical protein
MPYLTFTPALINSASNSKDKMSKLKIVIVMTILVLSSGCSTTSKLLATAPESFISSKPEQAIVVCLSETWTKRDREVRVNPMTDGQRVTMNISSTSGPVAIVEVRAAGTGSEARFWKVFGFTEWTRDDLKACL